MEIVALIAGIVSITLALFAIWQANHHRDQSDKLNRDTTEKLARIEAFATSTKEDAFAEIKRWGDFARAGPKASKEAEKAKEEELRNLKDEIQNTTSKEINKVLQTVESKLSSSIQPSTISEIKKEFEELKNQIGKIQEKGLGEVKRLESERLKSYWLSLPSPQRDLLARVAESRKYLVFSSEDFEKVGISRPTELDKFARQLLDLGFISDFLVSEAHDSYAMRATELFRDFLKTVVKDEME